MKNWISTRAFSRGREIDMKAIEALELGKDCGLDDVLFAMFNVELHSANLFCYDEIDSELKELSTDFNRLWALGGNLEMSIDDAIELMNS